jgi:hypothetical protein
MKLENTPFNTANGLKDFSRILTSALREASQHVKHHDVFDGQYALRTDRIAFETGHCYYGRDLGTPQSILKTNLWIGLDLQTTEVNIAFTIITDAANAGWLSSVKNAVVSPLLDIDPNLPKQNGLYIRLNQSPHGDICSGIKPQCDKVKTLRDFIMEVDKLW